MKKLKIFGLIAGMVATFISCETQVDDPAGARGEASVPKITDLNPAVYDVNDLENTFVQFKLVIDDPKVTEAVILVTKGDKKRVEVARVSSFPATVKLVLKDVVAKLGIQLSSIKPADVFNVEVVTVQGGKSYFSSAAFKAAVVCGYDPLMVIGSYHAVSDDWGLDGNVTITVDPDDEYIVYVTGLASVEGLVEDKGPLKMVINPLDFSVKAAKTVLASDIKPWGLPYTGYYYEGAGTLNTCNGTYTMNFTIGVDQGNWGVNAFTLTKN